MNPSRWLTPLTPLYALGLALKNRRYDRNPNLAQRLDWPVVSVGNLSAGGAGKTPVVMRLAEMLREEQIVVDVLSRGYGRSSTSIEPVDPKGEATRFGDEPLLIAARAGVPVYVGASRYQAGQLAEQQAAEQGVATGVHLLDDGFQHRALARSLDVVVLHASDFTESLLPAGRLREPLSALRRASVLVLREQDKNFMTRLDALGLAQPRWLIRRELALPEPCMAGEPVLAFCGIARPQEFFTSLKASGARVVAELAFADHHRWTEADLEQLLRLKAQKQAQALLTTEKDWIRLTTAQRAKVQSVAPLLTAGLKVCFLEEKPVREQLRKLVVRLPS